MRVGRISSASSFGHAVPEIAADWHPDTGSKRRLQSNQSAARSLEEGLEETLTLHRLGLFAKMGRSFKTTNCIESLNAGAEKHCGKVKYWKNSNQKHRWLACALLEIEPTLNKVAGSTHLPELRKKLMKELKIDQEKDSSN